MRVRADVGFGALHGIVHAEFRRYAIDRLGAQGWSTALENAGLVPKAYAASSTHPDEELFERLLAFGRATGEPLDAVLIDFGRSAVPGLLATYGAFIDPRWSMADVLENVERVIHRTIRLQEPDATPPYLTAVRERDREVVIQYTSPRRLCAFGKGLILGLAASYGETATVSDDACMHRGDSACILRVALN